MRVVRTPEDRFAGLPDFSYPPRYADVDGLRIGYVEAGPPDGEPVLLLHGEPSWSFLYRHVMPVLADAGLRAIAPDLVGFGRSDKSAEIGDHSYMHTPSTCISPPASARGGGMQSAREELSAVCGRLQHGFREQWPEPTVERLYARIKAFWSPVCTSF